MSFNFIEKYNSGVADTHCHFLLALVALPTLKCAYVIHNALSDIIRFSSMVVVIFASYSFR